MEKNYKRVPFDLETAKKIQAGDIAGSIKTKNGLTCKIVSYCDGTDFFVERKTEVGYCRWCYPYTKDGRYIDGKNNGGTDYDLILEVPEEAPKHEFKPFDKVLVRNGEHDGYCCWYPAFFSRYSEDKNGNVEYVTLDGFARKQCIPYEGNEHLLGTTNNPE